MRWLRRRPLCVASDRAGDLLARFGHRIESAVELHALFYGVPHLADLLAQILEIGLAHGLHELSLKLRRHAAHFRSELPKRTQNARQVLRGNRNKRDDGDDDKLAGFEIEHACCSGALLPPLDGAGRSVERFGVG